MAMNTKTTYPKSRSAERVQRRLRRFHADRVHGTAGRRITGYDTHCGGRDKKKLGAIRPRFGSRLPNHWQLCPILECVCVCVRLLSRSHWFCRLMTRVRLPGTGSSNQAATTDLKANTARPTPSLFFYFSFSAPTSPGGRYSNQDYVNPQRNVITASIYREGIVSRLRFWKRSLGNVY